MSIAVVPSLTATVMARFTLFMSILFSVIMANPFAVIMSVVVITKLVEFHSRTENL